MITDIRLQHFRSYNDEVFEFSNNVNIVAGPNGSGKTNLLEAILIIGRGNSYRAKDQELIQFEQSWARLDGHLDNNGTRTVKLTPEASKAKSYALDGKLYQRLSLDKTLPIVLFEPDHLRLLSGSPDRRRDYLDDLLEQTITGYSSLRRRYRRTLAQRNALLKRPGGQSKSQIFPWNVRLSELAGQMVRNRSKLCDQIDDQAADLYKKISSSNTDIKIEYQNSWAVDNYETQLLKQLDKNWESDQLRGFTSSGPHREDFRVLYNDHPAQVSASRGEIRTIILALKIIELQLIESIRNTTPLLLLDDVFSELDGKRRHVLTDYLSKYQTFITTTDADLILQNFVSDSNVISLS